MCCLPQSSVAVNVRVIVYRQRKRQSSADTSMLTSPQLSVAVASSITARREIIGRVVSGDAEFRGCRLDSDGLRRAAAVATVVSCCERARDRTHLRKHQAVVSLDTNAFTSPQLSVAVASSISRWLQ